jgi:hypothetical protein
LRSSSTICGQVIAPRRCRTEATACRAHWTVEGRALSIACHDPMASGMASMGQRIRRPWRRKCPQEVGLPMRSVCRPHAEQRRTALHWTGCQALTTQPMKRDSKLSQPADVLYRIKRGLSGYVSYLAACEMNQAFSEYVLYEPILRILTARNYLVQCEVECPGFGCRVFELKATSPPKRLHPTVAGRHGPAAGEARGQAANIRAR